MTRVLRLLAVIVVGPGAALAPVTANAQERHASPPSSERPPEHRGPNRGDFAREFQNPLPNLVSLTAIGDVDLGLGEGDGESRVLLRLVALLPMQLTSDWNLVVQSTLPVHSNPPPLPGADRLNGSGDLLQRLLLSPAKIGLLAWGVGPALELPTASRTALGTGQVSLGPALSLVHQEPRWTVALRAWHLWSVTGVRGARAVERTHLQPSAAFTFASGLSLGLGSETLVNWRAPESGDRLALPLTVTVGRITEVASQSIHLEVGGRYYLLAPGQGPEWGIRLAVAALFPIRRDG